MSEIQRRLEGEGEVRVLRARVAELEQQLAEAIKEIGVWSRKAGLAESDRDRLKAMVERVEKIVTSGCGMFTMVADIRALLPTPPKGGDDE